VRHFPSALATVALMAALARPAAAQDVASVVAKARDQVESGAYADALRTLAIISNKELPETVAIEAGLLETTARIVVDPDGANKACDKAVVAADYDPEVAGNESPKVRAACRASAERLRGSRLEGAGVRAESISVKPPTVGWQPVRVAAKLSTQPAWLRLVARVQSSVIDGSFDVALVPAESGVLRTTLDPSALRPGSKVTVAIVAQDKFGDLGSPLESVELKVPQAEAMVALGRVPEGAVVEVDGVPSKHDKHGRVPVSAGEHQVELTLEDGSSASASVEVARGTVARLALVPQPSSTANTVAWIFAGSAIAFGGVGAVLLVSAESRRAEIEDAAAAREPGTLLPATEYSEIESKESERATFATLGTVFAIAGAASAVAAVTLWLWPGPDGGDTVGLSVQPSPQGARVGVTGSF
jgi:hypothetical protein